MTQYCYIKKGFGIRTSATGYTSKQTGSFATLGAANCYDSYTDAITYNTLVSSDFICLSDASDERGAATVTYDTTVECYVLTVSDTNCDQASTGGIIGTTSAGAYDCSINSGDAYHGVDVYAGRTIYHTNAASDNLSLKKCNLYIGNFGAGYIQVNGNYRSFVYKNVSATFANAITRGIYMAGLAQTIMWDGGTITFPAASSLALLNPNGDSNIIDFRNVKVVNNDVIVQLSANANTFIGQFHNCTFPSGVTLLSGIINDNKSYLEFYNSDIGNVYNIFTGYYYTGNVLTDTGIYHSATYDGTNYYSFRAQPNTNVSIFRPLKIKVGEIVADCSTAKTFTVKIARDDSTTALTDAEVWLEVVYPDDTTTQSFAETDRNSDIWAAGTAQTSGSGWTGLTGSYKEQELAVTTTITGKNGVCEVYAYLAVDIDVYIDPVITVS